MCEYMFLEHKHVASKTTKDSTNNVQRRKLNTLQVCVCILYEYLVMLKSSAGAFRISVVQNKENAWKPSELITITTSLQKVHVSLVPSQVMCAYTQKTLIERTDD